MYSHSIVGGYSRPAYAENLDSQDAEAVYAFTERAPDQAAPSYTRRVKRALMTGITGQDGSYLTEQLLEQLLVKGHEVHGIVRRSSFFKMERIDPIYCQGREDGAKLLLNHGDLTDSSRMVGAFTRSSPTRSTTPVLSLMSAPRSTSPSNQAT